uniref:TPR_REGION domain-containing protein n=1 Tax=Syphacia muris TaxID=451379 RepID=A0A0N5AJT0_9BILA
MRSISQLESAYRNIGDYAKLIEVLEQQLQIHPEINDQNQEFKVKIHQKIGEYALKIGKFELALQHIDSVLQMPTIKTGLLFGVLSKCYLMVKQYGNARKCSNNELKLGITLKCKKLQLDALKNLSTAYNCVNDQQNALAILVQCDRLVPSNKIAKKLAIKLSVAKQYELCGQADQACKILKQRLSIAERSGSVSLQIDAHSMLNRFYRRTNSAKHRKYHFVLENKLYKCCTLDEKKLLVLEDRADFQADCKSYEKAVTIYEQCLMIYQENGNMPQEAEICEKLGNLHLEIYEKAESLRYFQQSLVVYQQLKQVESMMRVYKAIGNVYIRMHKPFSALNCFRYYASAASLLNDNSAKLDALTRIGLTLLSTNEYLKAKKVFLKALNCAKTIKCAAEVSTLQGYVVYCTVAADPQTCPSNFYQQLACVDRINDAYGQCEILRHIIKKECIKSSLDWILRLNNIRITLSRNGTVQLQTQVLKEAVITAIKLKRNTVAEEYLKQCLFLSTQLEFNESDKILRFVANVYKRYEQCLKTVTELQQQNARCFINALAFCSNMKKLKQQISVVQQALSTESPLADTSEAPLPSFDTNTTGFYQIMDATNSYKWTSENFCQINETARIHWLMAHNDIAKALQLIDDLSAENPSVECVANLDKAICLFLLDNYEACAEFLKQKRNNFSNNTLDSGDDCFISLLSLPYTHRQICHLMVAIELLSLINSGYEVIDTLVFLEAYRWSSYNWSNKCLTEKQITAKELENSIHLLRSAALYQFQVGKYQILWKINDGIVLNAL